MKERLITLLCAVGALALFYAIFIPEPMSLDEKISEPTTAERGNNGYLAALRWLKSTAVRVESLRRRYDWLKQDASKLAPTGNLLIVTLPHKYGTRQRELEQLWSWVATGNTVLVLAALADTPDWTMAYVTSYLPEDVESITGVRFFVPPPDDGLEARSKPIDAATVADAFKRLTELTVHRIVPNRRHPYFEGVREVVAESEYFASEWRASPPLHDFILSLAHDADTGRDAFWVRLYGDGQFLISGYASLFSNEQLGKKDNARLLANIAAQSLGADGAVLFDDQHQGLSTLYDAGAFYADWRLHATLWLLLALWLTWVLGSVRLRGVAVEAPAPRETALVKATGGFLARVLLPVQAGHRLVELFFNDLRRRLSLREDGLPMWDWLERQPRVSRADLETLRALEGRLQAGRRVDLVRLQNLLVKLQGQV
jgi:hypothetical protein